MMNEYKDYEAYDFGDKRIGKRIARILEEKTQSPQLSIHAMSKTAAESKAAYRLLGNLNLQTEALVNASHMASVERVKESKEPVILVPQDTTQLDYHGLKSTEGLGFIGDSPTHLGAMLHSAIAVTTEGLPLGLLYSKMWTRPVESFGAKKGRGEKLIGEKESGKWLETMQGASADKPEGVTYIHICDREGDIYPFFSAAIEQHQHFIVRNIHNRRIRTSDGAVDKLMPYMAEAVRASNETVVVRVPRDSHTRRQKRDAVLHVAYQPVTVGKSSYGHDEVLKEVSLYSLCAEELDAPKGAAPICWHLLSTEPIRNLDEAAKVMQWYTQRWKIELFHRVLKEGCKVECLQEDTIDKLEKLIAIYAIVAINLLDLTYMGRVMPDFPCDIMFTEEEWKILYQFSHRTRALPPRVPTMAEAVMMIARLGGFGGRPSDGYPGTKSLWLGLQKFAVALDFSAFS